HRRQVLAVRLHWSAQPARVRTGDGDDRPVVPTDPWHHSSVVEPQPELHPHRHPAGDALCDANDVWRLPARRHEVEKPYGALGRLELGLQHQRLAAVAAAYGDHPTTRRDPPRP